MGIGDIDVHDPEMIEVKGASYLLNQQVSKN